METDLFYNEAFVKEYHRAIQLFWGRADNSLLATLFEPEVAWTFC